MTRNGIALTLLLTTIAGVARAQDGLNGTWEGETGSGSSIVLTLAVKGTSLTGTIVRNGESTALTDGKASKNTFTFKATLSDQAEGLSGELAGDEIRIWLDRQGRSRAIVLRRAKREKPR
ncbi:MAG: hypothetical protein ACRD1U_05390 [Vicinamibacterales bacterium]